MDFYKYLLSQFSSIEEAKQWYHTWRDEWEQDIPNHPEWSGNNCFSMRTMAGHISCALTGDDYDGCYMNTEHGSEIYLS